MLPPSGGGSHDPASWDEAHLRRLEQAREVIHRQLRREKRKRTKRAGAEGRRCSPRPLKELDAPGKVFVGKLGDIYRITNFKSAIDAREHVRKQNVRANVKEAIERLKKFAPEQQQSTGAPGPGHRFHVQESNRFRTLKSKLNTEELTAKLRRRDMTHRGFLPRSELLDALVPELGVYDSDALCRYLELGVTGTNVGVSYKSLALPGEKHSIEQMSSSCKLFRPNSNGSISLPMLNIPQPGAVTRFSGRDMWNSKMHHMGGIMSPEPQITLNDKEEPANFKRSKRRGIRVLAHSTSESRLVDVLQRNARLVDAKVDDRFQASISKRKADRALYAKRISPHRQKNSAPNTRKLYPFNATQHFHQHSDRTGEMDSRAIWTQRRAGFSSSPEYKRIFRRPQYPG